MEVLIVIAVVCLVFALVVGCSAGKHKSKLDDFNAAVMYNREEFVRLHKINGDLAGESSEKRERYETECAGLRRENIQLKTNIETLRVDNKTTNDAYIRMERLWQETMRANRELREEKQRMLDRIARLERPRDAKGRFAKR